MNKKRFEDASTFLQFLDSAKEHRDMWHAVYERTRLPEEVVDEATKTTGVWNLLALSEDWCGDAVNTLPVIARLAERVGWDLRVLGRDDNPDLMDAHLSEGRSRSIPIVIFYDEHFKEIGWWGPRPTEIQSWVRSEGLSMSSADRYKVIRAWYARDRGRTTLIEILDVMSSATRLS